MDLSIVIPAYKEAHKIAKDVAAASGFLVDAGLSGEVIVADDGSPDDTAGVAEKASVAPGVALRVLRLEHKGKGHAVRKGMVATRGEFAMFADSGVCVPYEDALRGLEMIRHGGVAIANGSRKMQSSVIARGQGFYRRTLSKMFRWTVFHYLGLPKVYTDTQCGFKVYRGEVARRIYGQCRTDGFLFDLEVLIRAMEAGDRVGEFPVRWACDPDSRLKPSRVVGEMLVDLRALKRMIEQERAEERIKSMREAYGLEDRA